MISVPTKAGGAPAPALRVAVSPKRVRCHRSRPAKRKSPLEKGAVSGADWGFLPRVRRREKNPPGIAFGHASPLFKGGKTGGHAGPPLRHDRTRPPPDEKAPLKRGLSAKLTGGFCPRVQYRRENPPACLSAMPPPFSRGVGRAATRGRPYGKSGNVSTPKIPHS